MIDPVETHPAKKKWLNKSEEEKEAYRQKCRAVKQAYWANMSNEERVLIKNKIKDKNKQYWNSLSDEAKREHSIKTQQYYNSLSDEAKEQWRQTSIRNNTTPEQIANKTKRQQEKEKWISLSNEERKAILSERSKARHAIRKAAFEALSIDEQTKILEAKRNKSLMKRRIRDQRYYNKNKEKIIARRQADPKYKLKAKKWREDNKELTKRLAKDYYKNNKEKYNAYVAEWRRKRYVKDPQFRIRAKIRNMMSRAIKTKHTEEILGCSYDVLCKYLESRFLEGMSWDNYNKDGWHIDHIVPLSWFDLSNPDEVAKANHYTNLQPMWAKDNLSKNNRHCMRADEMDSKNKPMELVSPDHVKNTGTIII